ncbi:hypothetical protein NQ317_002269 [Molorchus minor]|uniref:C-CAP/cofactor C-like domain-containing protein n=1 Tax=Molorchus minor TaxID=1323400 RepID=A0ABQ9JYM2_9CUCU|nr:hypothetical protein NQ317_002269 [Molorchus minor]
MPLRNRIKYTRPDLAINVYAVTIIYSLVPVHETKLFLQINSERRENEHDFNDIEFSLIRFFMHLLRFASFLVLGKTSLEISGDLGNTLVVNIPHSKTRVSRTFPVITEAYIDLYRKYLALRPAYVNHQRLFIKYTSNKCTIQPVGINIFGKMPTDIARFLKLPNSELYTGHCFRRTSASLLADSGANLCTIKRHGGWKSSSVAEGYLEDSLENKKRIACHILPNNCPSSNNSEIEHINSISSTASSSISTISSYEVASSQGINITNCSNCTINIDISK